MSEFTKRAVLFCIGVGLVLFGAWLSGMEFERGIDLAIVYWVALLFGGALAGYPGIKGDA
jgi:hypothetical protein